MVYLAKFKRNGLIKVGSSNSFNEHLKELEAKGGPVEVLAVVPCSEFHNREMEECFTDLLSMAYAKDGLYHPVPQLINLIKTMKERGDAFDHGKEPDQEKFIRRDPRKAVLQFNQGEMNILIEAVSRHISTIVWAGHMNQAMLRLGVLQHLIEQRKEVYE